MSSFVTVIPARGGSKGIIRKNLQTVGGLPLISRAARQALKAETGPVIVSSDDRDILDEAIDCGACVHKRSPETSGDCASSESVLLEVVRSWKKLPDYLIFCQCTAPFMLAEDIAGTAKSVVESGADCGLACCEFHRFLWKNTNEAYGVNHDCRKRSLRQQRDKEYLEAGSVYVMRTKGFLEHKHRFFGKIAIYEIPECRSMEIDTVEDLQIARQLAPLFDPPPVGQVIYVDIDETLCITPPSRDYRDAVPVRDAIRRVNNLHTENTIVCWTARGTMTGEDHEEMTKQQLNSWGVKYDKLVLGKPAYGWLYDDKAMPSIGLK